MVAYYHLRRKGTSPPSGRFKPLGGAKSKKPRGSIADPAILSQPCPQNRRVGMGSGSLSKDTLTVGPAGAEETQFHGMPMIGHGQQGDGWEQTITRRGGKSLEEVGTSEYVGYISCAGPSRGWILAMNLVMAKSWRQYKVRSLGDADSLMQDGWNLLSNLCQALCNLLLRLEVFSVTNLRTLWINRLSENRVTSKFDSSSSFFPIIFPIKHVFSLGNSSFSLIMKNDDFQVGYPINPGLCLHRLVQVVF